MALLITGTEGRSKKAGILPGYKLISINGEPVLDFIDYNWFQARRELALAVETPQGKRVFRISKPPEEPIGLQLDGLYPEEKRCANRCIFCFVDQMAPDMRQSLYVKDDDWRYSVLFGNYITLTNISDSEFERLLKRAPSPLYVSVHATDPDVRGAMMGNRQAGRIMEQLGKLAAASITLHCQVVLVPGYNDGVALDNTLDDLYSLYPGVRTVAVVPVGLTCYRQGLAELKPVGKAEAEASVEAVERFADKALAARGVRFAFAADELYERAGLPAKRYSSGEHTPQLANGVGMVSNLLDEFEWALPDLPHELEKPRMATIATGVSAYELMVKIASALCARVGGLRLSVIKVENRLFGPGVTVAGLICSGDIAHAAEGWELGDELLIPQAALRSGEDVFLDGSTLGQLSELLNVPVRAVPCDGAALAYAACGLEEET